jgi:hypothetical protein
VCLTHHDRDVNSANVIRARGLVWLDGEFLKEFSATGEVKADEAVVNKSPQGFGAGHGPLVAGIPSFLAQASSRKAEGGRMSTSDGLSHGADQDSRTAIYQILFQEVCQAMSVQNLYL